MKADGKAARKVALLTICFLAPVAVFAVLDLRINLTASHVPAGIWRARPPGVLKVGDVIDYNKDEFYAARPEIGEERMSFVSPIVIKRVAALPGATIARSRDALAIDGAPYPKARIGDESWRKVDYPLTVPDGHVWLMADSAAAYDSRYHGPLPMDLVREKLTPVLVWGENEY
ncbi:MAG: S26 family signal peptidase [Synergistaceae bacterium]|jgi:type IV secretory pathway protease TraF|nr:S26 family signal peptidase [Synergistaceae bacterium]